MANVVVWALLACVVVVFHRRNPFFVALRRLWTAPVPIATIEHGSIVRVCGRIEVLDEELDGPLSGRACVHYDAAVSERRRDSHCQGGSRGRPQWLVLHSVRRSVDFIVRDATGAAIVRVNGAAIHARVDHTSRASPIGEPSTTEAAFLERFGEDRAGILGFNRALRFSEEALEVGEEVSVVGEARRVDGPIPTLIVAPPDDLLLITDSRLAARVGGKRAR